WAIRSNLWYDFSFYFGRYFSLCESKFYLSESGQLQPKTTTNKIAGS
ncbi:MAG: hypothetical protein ACJA0M_001002, partial [Chitinophagales bacterium]